MIHLESFRRLCHGLTFTLALSWAASAAAQVQLVNAIPALYSNEANTDCEPGLTVDPANPGHIVLTAFTPCPSMISTTNAPIYFSMDGGNTWQLNCIVPGNNSIYGTGDITTSLAGSGVLYAGVLRGDSFLEMNILRTSDFTSATPMVVLVDRFKEDQPYTWAVTAVGDRVFIGNNNLANSIFFGGTTGQTASVDSSLSAATAPAPAGFGTRMIEARSTCGQDVPSVRPAIHSSGTIYAAYLRNAPGSSCFSGSNTVDVVVARDDNWGSGATPFTSLTDTGDAQPGVRVVTNRVVVWMANLGTERIGSSLSIAVDPNDRQKVYLAWADGASGSTYTLHVRRSTDSGATWSADLKTVVPATNPALAVNSQGKVGFLYQTLVNPGTCQGGGPGVACWETHFETYDGTAWTDLPHPLANVPDNAGSFSLGDYAHVLAVGADFYGAFAANNYPDTQNFYPGVQYQRYVDWPSHKLFADAAHTATAPLSVDPFYFHVKETQTPLQRWVGSLHAGATLPHSNLSAFSSSISLGIDLEYRLNAMYSLETYLGYDRFSSNVSTTPDLWFVSLSERLKATFGPGPLRPFVFLGLGPYFPRSGSTRLGVNAGVGIQNWVTPHFAIEGTYTFHTVFTPVTDTRYSTLLAGVRFTL